jgi:cytochrome b subunit of formate dehydrogenase
MRELGMTWIAVLLVLGLLGGAFAHLAAGRRIARLLGVPEVSATGPAPDLGAPLTWIHFCAWGLVLALIVTGAGFLMTYGPTPLPGLFSSRHAVRLHVVAGFAFAALVPLLAVGWVATDLVRKRGSDWVNAWGGFLWNARGRGDGKALPWDRLWIWIDLLCALAVAATGLVMAMHVPAVGRLAPAFLHHLADHHILGPLAYAVHGMAGSALVGRLVMHLYALFILRKRS